MSPGFYLKELGWPAAFVASASYSIWHTPDFIILYGGKVAHTARYAAAGVEEFVILAIVAISMVMGSITAEASNLEEKARNPMDRISLFLGRVSMLLIVVMVSVMFYEVIVRYVFEAPTLWANELTLWISGFVFLLSGLYAMQQRSHIRIFLFYEKMPRLLQKLCDSVSTLLIFAFAFCMVWGGYNEMKAKVLRWETFGTAFDPPIPATLKTSVLAVICLVTLQAMVNLVADWNKAVERRGPVDEDEIKDLAEDVRRGARKGSGGNV